MQQLAEPLQQHLLKIVQKESNAEWSKTPIPQAPQIKKCEGIKNDTIWKHMLRDIINTAKELRP